MAHYKILSDAEIRAALAELPDWSLKAPNIEARFELKTFRDAIAFIVEVAIQELKPQVAFAYSLHCYGRV